MAAHRLAVPDEHMELFAAVTGELVPWPTMTAYWTRRLHGAAQRARRCPAVRWRLVVRRRCRLAVDRRVHRCAIHASRGACLLSSGRRALIPDDLDGDRMRQRLKAVEADRLAAPEEIWHLRDAGRDTHTPAADALAQMIPPQLPFADVHAGMLTSSGERLDLPTGTVPVLPPLRRALPRQRTTSVLCKGPADYPLLTVMHRYVLHRESPPRLRQMCGA